MSNERDLHQQAPGTAASDAGDGGGGWSLDHALALEAERYQRLACAIASAEGLTTLRKESKERIADLLRRAGFAREPPKISAQPVAKPDDAAGAMADRERHEQQGALRDEVARWRSRAEEGERRAAELDARISALGSQLDDLRQRAREHADETAALQTRAGAAEARCATLESEMAEVTPEQQALRRELAEAVVSHATERARAASLEAAVSAERERADLAEKSALEALAESEAAQLELRRERESTALLESAAVEARAKAEAARRELLREREHTAQLESAAVEARAQAEALRGELLRERERTAQLENELCNTQGCLHRATELLLHSPGGSEAEAPPSQPSAVEPRPTQPLFPAVAPQRGPLSPRARRAGRRRGS